MNKIIKILNEDVTIKQTVVEIVLRNNLSDEKVNSIYSLLNKFVQDNGLDVQSVRVNREHQEQTDNLY